MSPRDDRHPDELISALFDGELAPEEWTEVKEHLESCPRCRRLLEQIKSISAAMPVDPPVPEGLAARVQERLPAGTGRQRPVPPARDRMPYRATRRRLTFPLAAGAALAATLIVGALLIQYLPEGVSSRLRLPRLSPPSDGAVAESAGEAAAPPQPAMEAKREAPVLADNGSGAAPPGSGSDADASVAATDLAASTGAPGTFGVPAGPAATDYAAAGERPGLAPGQDLPVTVPEEADAPARTAEQIALEQARPGAVGGVEGAAPAGANELPEAAKDQQARARPAEPEAAAGAATANRAEVPARSAAAAQAAAPPPLADATPQPSSSAPVAPAASVAACQATWSAPRQAVWPPSAGRNPERAVGGAGQAAGGRSILMENPRRVRITVTRDRWPDLVQKLAAAGVTGTAQLPAPPEWADCAAVNVSVPEASPSTPAPPPPGAAPPPPSAP
ncbi:MAG: zf-HC2 domain-containing protein [Acidobacteria bacterium]|jgi:anti-sigma factor RsiW|nr:zf-HC2 domain-containing protein [Acidobacteriota bacterium]